MQALGSGYIDLWSLRNKKPRMTCCFDEFVNNKMDSLYERIDHILLLQNGLTIDKAKAITVGDHVSDMTKTEPRLWPSDHAGVVGQIYFMNGD